MAEDGHEDIQGEEEDVEAQSPKAMKAPKIPTAREVEEHELTHCPPRSWCEHCVRGQAKDRPHCTIRGVDGESEVPRVSMDYCFLTEDVKGAADEHQTSETAKTSMTVLVMTETLCRSVWAYACQSKGAGE